MRVTDQQVAAACDVASQVFAGKLRQADAIKVLETVHGINKNSARDYIEDYKHLARGEVFQRAMSASAMEHFIERISTELGDAGLSNAVQSLQAHIRYYEGYKKGRMHLMRQVADRFSARVARLQERQAFERALDDAVRASSKLSTQARQERLASAPRLPGQTTVTTTVFQRNPDVIAEVLLRANGRCESCRKAAPFQRASDGTPYLEVHHVVTLASGGEDTVENAIALCPNCHRKAHLG